MTILVTGSAGFIGSNFVLDWLAARDEEVISLDKLTYAGNPENLKPLEGDERHRLVQGDIGDTDLVKSLLAEYRPRAIINFAAESHVDRSILGPEAFVQTNIVGTFRVLETAKAYWESLSGDEKSAFRFLHVSTDEVYGTLDPADPAFSEANAYRPNSPYSASKASSDHLVRAYFHTYGLPVLTTNCSNNYGPFQFPEKLIPLVIHNALAGKPLPIYGDGKQVRDWLYVGDHCSAIRRVLEAGEPGEVYNIGGKNEKTNLEVVQTLCTLLDELAPPPVGASAPADRQVGSGVASVGAGLARDTASSRHQSSSVLATDPKAGNRAERPPASVGAGPASDNLGYSSLITYVKDRPGHDRRYAIDATKIEQALGWYPNETFETGIRKTVQWYLDNQAWVENVTSGQYRQWVEAQYA